VYTDEGSDVYGYSVKPYTDVGSDVYGYGVKPYTDIGLAGARRMTPG